MLKYLKYKLKFSSTGKTFSQEIKFKPGLTVITGANEKGKSLVLEMIEYAWFGVDALRGQLRDYEVLEVELHWNDHVVIRNGSSQSLDKTKAVGASAVNKEILAILGINLETFRIACSAKQGELDRLTARMRPTERRKMVDEVIGLNQLEIAEAACRREANGNKRLRDDLAKRQVQPVEPDTPSDYEPSELLEEHYRTQLKAEAERNQLLKVAKPYLPAEPQLGEDSDDLEHYETRRKAVEAERAGLERTLRAIPPAKYSRSDIEYAERFYAHTDRGPAPLNSIEQLNEWQKAWPLWNQLAQSVHCPACGIDFVPGQSDAVQHVEKPPLTVAEIRIEFQRHDRWADYDGSKFEAEPELKRSEIETQKQALAQAEVRETIEKQLAYLPELESRAKELADKLRYERELASYMDQLVIWSEAQERLEQIPESDPNLEEKLTKVRNYEEQKRRYDADVVAFNTREQELQSLNAEVEAFNKGAEALKYVRSQVKQHLVPSLNRVASHLLSEMTNGQRKKIEVTEDFEVSVDGQPVRTLSGSGISVVNLALRIALGQVLTQRSIPIFLADEIDHDMDADRAKATHTAIRALTKDLNQIIVVSHKQVDADQTIGV